MFTSSAMMTKSDKEKAWLGIRSVCVLVPIMGLTWVFGVFSVNENMVAFQYIFAICNSLQGLLIFIFHCVLNKQLKDGLKQRSKRKKSLATFEQSYNKQSNQHSTGEPTGFTGIGDSKSTSNSNELEKATTNPFLEADRQMKELTKTKKGGTANLCDNNVITNNKLDKGAPGARAVDLDDVKISNILRESEVMSGTAGISSILPKPERRQPEQTGSRTPEEQRKFVKWFLGQSGSGQNISSIATALPQKYDQHQGKNKKGSTSSSKKTDSLPKKEKGGKKPKGGQLRDHSRAYEYSYDTTYLGGSSRHASLENMNMQHQYGYSQYGHMPGMSGYQTGRPTHQQQHWDQYHYPQDQYGRSQYW
ncbi:uncharacterized protein LOC128238402 isoform X5 [Mya arenaria]|uniref:uncharacterized protein LOC128238402 isoform X5 n=1 Tax=Mya arenaria TaxID=6604 RepID=UPI0022E56FF0|nr:uncharacterized protein LOC128238402 isoform X5 [Mya arenaria]